ncbi:MAG: ATP-binding protein [Planctomycetota bacterium]
MAVKLPRLRFKRRETENDLNGTSDGGRSRIMSLLGSVVQFPRLSLATKCQLLFGLAVAAIITAALFVPWARMEQLSRDIDQKAAATAAELALGIHIKSPQTPTYREGDAPIWVEFVAPVTPELDAFEEEALTQFTNDPTALPVYSPYYTDDGERRFRYGAKVLLNQDCRGCHGLAPGTDLGGSFAVVTVDLPSQISRRQQMLNRALLVTGLVLAGSLAVLVLWFILSRLILRPVRVLQTAAEQVSRGDLNVRSDIGSGDEFQTLSETFNAMLLNIAEQQTELQRMNQTLDGKLGQLAESNVALYESNRLKSEFLANVSHELRTPLNSILGFTDLLRDTFGDDEKAARYLRNIATSGRGLLDLINDLLDLAKIEAGRMEVRRDKVSVTTLLENIEQALRPLWLGKKIDLVRTVDADVPVIETDPGKLQQVLYNLLSNAIKFSPNGGRIDLQAERTGSGEVRISVADQGPGIPADRHDEIFEKFRQLDQGVTRTHGGTGLGLAISRELTDLLGGRIAIESTPGKGATFLVTLPLVVPDERKASGHVRSVTP